MAFRPARLAVIAAFAASLVVPATASAVESSGGSAAPTATTPGIKDVQPSGGAEYGAIEPPPPPKKKPKSKSHRSSSGSKSTKHKSHSARPRFPVAGPHSYGGPEARFGAPRSGHTHQGQDLLAAEGTPLVAPLRGVITYTGYQAGGAGIYVVMHASGTRYDFAFMHLQARHAARQRRPDRRCDRTPPPLRGVGRAVAGRRAPDRPAAAAAPLGPLARRSFSARSSASGGS
ncbi:MAG: hypothetical protein E6G29_12625 [Actinobacteria bacterium]|nr:MAG: hypothetical protein E6G29_12625 [Actinomycetota bacterium]